MLYLPYVYCFKLFIRWDFGAAITNLINNLNFSAVSGFIYLYLILLLSIHCHLVLKGNCSGFLNIWIGFPPPFWHLIQLLSRKSLWSWAFMNRSVQHAVFLTTGPQWFAISFFKMFFKFPVWATAVGFSDGLPFKP